MRITKRQHRTIRKLVLPLIAIGLMTTMMYIGSLDPPQQSSTLHSRR